MFIATASGVVDNLDFKCAHALSSSVRMLSLASRQRNDIVFLISDFRVLDSPITLLLACLTRERVTHALNILMHVGFIYQRA
jgi:hypothetical protein